MRYKTLILACGMVCSSGIAKPAVQKTEIIEDCAIMNQARREGARDLRLVLAIAKLESSKNGRVVTVTPGGVSHYGLMQLQYGTARSMGFSGKPQELLEWKTNMKYGVAYLNEQLRKHRSNTSAAAAYNAGAVYICKKGRKDLITGKPCKRGFFVNQG